MSSRWVEGNGQQPLRPARNLLAVLVLFYMVAASMWCMPTGFPGKRSVEGLLSPLFLRLGLWQSWDMFSPNPRDQDIYLSARVFFSDGTHVDYSLSKMTDHGLLPRYQKERWRKFFNDNFRLDTYRALWPDGAAWVFRRVLQQTERLPVRIEFWRHWRPCVRPGQARPATFTSYRFYERIFVDED